MVLTEMRLAGSGMTALAQSSRASGQDTADGGVLLLIDHENIVYSLMNHDGRRPNIRVLKEYLTERFGHVIGARAYANWTDLPLQRDLDDLCSSGIEPAFVPTHLVAAPNGSPFETRSRRANSVDIKLVAEWVALALANADISTVVLVSGDGGYVHLINVLHAFGKKVVVVGCSWNTSRMLRNSADEFVAYDQEIDPISCSVPLERSEVDALTPITSLCAR